MYFPQGLSGPAGSRVAVYEHEQRHARGHDSRASVMSTSRFPSRVPSLASPTQPLTPLTTHMKRSSRVRLCEGRRRVPASRPRVPCVCVCVGVSCKCNRKPPRDREPRQSRISREPRTPRGEPSPQTDRSASPPRPHTRGSTHDTRQTAPPHSTRLSTARVGSRVRGRRTGGGAEPLLNFFIAQIGSYTRTKSQKKPLPRRTPDTVNSTRVSALARHVAAGRHTPQTHDVTPTGRTHGCPRREKS
jgi:hypothetical protein